MRSQEALEEPKDVSLEEPVEESNERPEEVSLEEPVEENSEEPGMNLIGSQRQRSHVRRARRRHIWPFYTGKTSQSVDELVQHTESLRERKHTEQTLSIVCFHVFRSTFH